MRYLARKQVLKKISWLVLPIFLVVVLQFILVNAKMLKAPALDFEVFYLSGQQVIHGQNPYIHIGKDIVRNPPPALLFFTLFPLFPMVQSQIIWFILSLVAFIGGSYLLLKILGDMDRDLFFNVSNWRLWLAYLSLVIVFFPFRHNLGSGQVNNLLFLLIVLVFYSSVHKKDFLSGFSLALAIMLKITPFIFFYILILHRRIRILLWSVISVIVILLVTAVLAGSEIYKNYLTITRSFFDFNVATYYNQSLAGFLASAFHNPELTQGVVLLALIAGLVYFFILSGKLCKDTFKANLIFWNISIIYMLIFAPFAWQHHFTIAIFPLLTTVYLGYKLRLSWIFLLFSAISYLLIGWNIKRPMTYSAINFWGAIITSHVFFGTLLLLILNYYLTNKLIGYSASKIRLPDNPKDKQSGKDTV